MSADIGGSLSICEVLESLSVRFRIPKGIVVMALRQKGYFPGSKGVAVSMNSNKQSKMTAGNPRRGGGKKTKMTPKEKPGPGQRKTSAPVDASSPARSGSKEHSRAPQLNVDLYSGIIVADIPLLLLVWYNIVIYRSIDNSL